MAASTKPDSGSRLRIWLTLALLLAVILCANLWRPAAAAGSQVLRDPTAMTLRVWPGKPMAAPAISQADATDQLDGVGHALAPQPLPQQARLKRIQPGQ